MATAKRTIIGNSSLGNNTREIIANNKRVLKVIVTDNNTSSKQVFDVWQDYSFESVGSPKTISKYNNTTDLVVKIPKDTSVTKISSLTVAITFDRVFGGCAVKEVYIPNTISEVGPGAFRQDSAQHTSWVDSIEKVVFDAGSPITRLDSSGLATYGSPFGKKLKTVVLPELLEQIDERLFDGCTQLKNITLPTALTYIGTKAFNGCTSLEECIIPDSVTSLGSEAFNGCSSLETVQLSANITAISSGTFRNCSSLTSITIPDGVTQIGEEAFKGCTSLTYIYIPESVTKIGARAFQGCTGLTSVGIYNSGRNITSLGSNIFDGCTSLSDFNSSYNLNYALKSTSYSYFLSNTAIDDIVFGAQVTDTKIGDYYCYNCTQLENIVLTSSHIVTIGTGAFKNCTSLGGYDNTVDLDYPLNNLTTINASAFEGCTNAYTFNLPQSLTSIGEKALYNSGFKTINYNGTMSEWGSITKGSNWYTQGGVRKTIHCTDGDITL